MLTFCEIKDVIKEIYYIFERKIFIELNNKGFIQSLTHNEISSLIEEYGGEIHTPPNDELLEKSTLIMGIKNSNEYIIHVDLYINNEISDLTLILKANKNYNNLSIFIDDIHVL